MTEVHKVVPLVGFDGIRFGDTRSQVRAYIKNTFHRDCRVFMQYNAPVLSENYITFNVHYDKDDRCKSVEFFNDCTVMVGDVTVLPGTVSYIRALFPGINDELMSYKDSIGLYVVEEEDVEAILFGKPDLYK